MPRQPCILGDPQIKGGKIRSGYLTLPSRGPSRGRKCYITPAFSGSPRPSAETKSEVAHRWHIAYQHAFSVNLVIFSLR